MKRLLHVWAVLAFVLTAGCDRSPNTTDPLMDDPAAVAPDVSVDPQATATDGEQTDTAATPVDGELPATSSPLPLAGAIGVFALGGAFILRSVRRRGR